MNITLALVMWGFLAPTVPARETLWEDLTMEVLRLVQEQRSLEAVEVAKRALEVAKETFGPGHPNVAVSLF